MSLAFLVMLSTLSFTVEKHFCGDTLVDVAVFTQAKKCGMEMTTNEAPVKKQCCKDEVELIKGQEDLKLNSFEDLSFEQIQVFTSFLYSYTVFSESLPKEIIPHKNYSSPNIVRDIQLLDDVFLI
ncbi:HYC_CC_PP family protein [Winogradskyella sp. A3E31]|uniref:HYC_CC_PP family protein n=1 Tax=Winogradskyella sp. A3E31 TaxID=3349637 RepID=UPI00398A79C8